MITQSTKKQPMLSTLAVVILNYMPKIYLLMNFKWPIISLFAIAYLTISQGMDNRHRLFKIFGMLLITTMLNLLSCTRSLGFLSALYVQEVLSNFHSILYLKIDTGRNGHKVYQNLLRILNQYFSITFLNSVYTFKSIFKRYRSIFSVHCGTLDI